MRYFFDNYHWISIPDQTVNNDCYLNFYFVNDWCIFLLWVQIYYLDIIFVVQDRHCCKHCISVKHLLGFGFNVLISSSNFALFYRHFHRILMMGTITDSVRNIVFSSFLSHLWLHSFFYENPCFCFAKEVVSSIS